MTITKGGTPSPSASPSGPSSGEAAGAGQFGNTASSSSGQVWMPGMSTQNSQFMSEAGQARNQRRQNGAWMSADDAANAYFNWTSKARDDFRAKGLLSGLLTQGAGDLESFSLWQTLVKQSALYGANGQMVSPLDILSGYVKGNSSGRWVKQGNFETNPLTGEKRYIGPKSKTTTQQQVDLTDPATARAIATKLFQDLLGRDPNSGEIAAYANALSQSEAQNPSTAVTTTQFDPATGDATNSSTVTMGGLTADAKAQMAADEIKSKKEYGVTQAATTYMNALTSAVGGA